VRERGGEGGRERKRDRASEVGGGVWEKEARRGVGV